MSTVQTGDDINEEIGAFMMPPTIVQRRRGAFLSRV
jgi:hypothetical protein